MSDGNGALPEGWAEANLDDLGEWKGGGTPRKSNSALWTNGKVPWVSPKDMKRFYLDDAEDRITHDAVKNSSAQLLPADSVLVVTRSGILQRILPVAINRVPVATNQDLKTLVPTEGIDARYVAYLLKGKDQHLRDECSKDGTTVASIDLPKLKAYKFGLAPEAEQRRIVSKIESLQARSSRARGALAEVGPLLEQFRASVLRAAFSGRLTADWRAAHPDVEPASELLERIRTERRHRWEQSELAKYKAKGKQPPNNWQQRYREAPPLEERNLPELPDGWVWTSADDVCSQITDGEHIQPKYTNTGFPMLTAKHVRDGFVTFKDAGLISEEDFVRCLARCAPTKDDILIVSVGATTGRTAIVSECAPFALVRSVLLLKPLLTSRFLLAWTKSPWCFDWMTSASGATAQAHLYITATKKMPVPIPPMDEQLEITRLADEVQERYDEVVRIVAESESSLTQLDQSILAKAFRGELVPQDPRDEPASALLERIRTSREIAAPQKKATRKQKTKAKA